jgi:chemotaxis protein MotA
MNFVNLAGIIFAAFIMIFSMVYGNPAPQKMIDIHGGMIVIGGTFACVGVAFSLPRAFSMLMIFFKGLFKTTVPKDINKKIIQELMQIAEAYRTDSPDLPGIIEKVSDPFLKEAMQALIDEVLEPKKLIRVLQSRVNTMYERYADDAKMFAACGKYPPAMGLMGAVTGMILLLGSLGEPGAEKEVGPHMSVALVATLYGIALANLFIIPIGEHLQEIAKKLKLKNTIIVEGIKVIQQKQNPVVLAEELNSYLLPSERLDWKAMTK